jgi:hypothetical protein
VAVTSEHEALHRIFQRDLELFARVMNRVLGVDLPVPDQVSVMTVDLTETLPVERRVDSVLLAQFIGQSSCGQYILVIESQTQPDEERRSRWPYAIAYLRDKYGCGVVLLVVCSKRATAQWARKPIKIGVGGLVSMVVSPAVLGPDNVPAVTDPAEAAQDVCFTMLSALTHSRSRQVGAILEVLADALTTVDAETGASLAEFTEAGLGKTAGRIIWRQLMATRTGSPYVSQMRREGQREGRSEGRREGRIEVRREDILRILDKRGIEVADEVRDAINGCDDTKILDKWFDLALVVTDSNQLLPSA